MAFTFPRDQGNAPALRAGDDVGDTGIPRSGGAPSFVEAVIRAAQRLGVGDRGLSTSGRFHQLHQPEPRVATFRADRFLN